MIINFIYNEKLESVILPEKISGQFWFTDPKGKNVFRIEGLNNKWIIKTTSQYSIAERNDNAFSDSQAGYTLFPGMLLYFRKNNSINDKICLFTENYTRDRIEFKIYNIEGDYKITVGSGSEPKTITYSNNFVSRNHAQLLYVGGNWQIQSYGRNGTFINGKKSDAARLSYGDIVFIMGMKIIVGYNCFSINNPDGLVSINSPQIRPCVISKMTEIQDEDLDENEDEEEYFDRSPRFKKEIKEIDLVIDPPPRPDEHEDLPAILTVGPAATMAMASLTTGSIAVANAASTGNIRAALPTLVMSISMFVGMLIWPAITRHYNKKQRQKKEGIRRQKYMRYLEEKNNEILSICSEQTDILRENIVTIDECEERILSIKRNLWERSIGNNDFLTLRIGIGRLNMFGKLRYNSRHFSLSDDDLESMMLSLCEAPKILENVPISISLLDRSIGVIGKKSDLYPFIKGIIIQLAALFSYDELKLVILYSPEDEEEFGFVKWFPHVWNKEKNCRFVATNADEIKTVFSYIERVFNYREEMNDSALENETPYYVVIPLDRMLFNRASILKSVLASKKKHHISVLSAFTELRNLPKECVQVVDIQNGGGMLFDNNDISGNVTSFISDICPNSSPLLLSTSLSNINLYDSGETSKLPKYITFLQMCGVGRADYLNCPVRWQENDPTKSLAVPVGVDQYGDLFMLDLHEKYHGPHGLVAGMTGSGKSEFIITYILSLAINFHPHEVSFIMIDYKGGGMAKSFENIPHTAGIITNLDGSAVKRSLVSIHSELKRRQSILTQASRLVGESNMNIYQYQRLYRQGTVKEPLSHLFIIADEFAELKTQQPEFMSELISAARIGRSLGVHLILATQKPSGVVDDQIWSNSRFRVCLKVQERQDSIDMLKRPDAAELSETGRFYLQVGYNEMFELGQSSWAGADYIPSDKVLVEKDNSVEAIDRTGRVIRSVKPNSSVTQSAKTRKQLDVITEYLESVAAEDGIKARALWLPPVAEKIYLFDLEKKYPEKSKAASRKNVIEPVIGEYDDPENQKQELLTLPITKEGNTIIYGASGSGKELLLDSLICSVIAHHTPSEVNFYLLDFGDEMLRCFEKAPHVGEVMLSSDGEKIARFFKLLYRKIKTRKKTLSLFGSDYSTYIKKCNGDSGMPAVIVVIQNFAAFIELFGEHEDDIVYLTREGIKYGIYFILTSLSPNGIRYRITQNFKQSLVLQQNDDNDYASVLGKTDGLFPAKIRGRGLVRLDKVVEFQSAHILKDKSSFDASKEISEITRNGWSGVTAEKIPILPDIVDSEYLLQYLGPDPCRLPVGICKNDLKPGYLDISVSPVSMVLSADDSYIRFLDSFVPICAAAFHSEIIVLDPQGKLSQYMNRADNKLVYAGTPAECAAAVPRLFEEIKYRNNTYKDSIEKGITPPVFKKSLCIAVSLGSVFGCLSEEGKERLNLVLEKSENEYEFRFVAGDQKDSVLQYRTKTWFKKNVSHTDGVWLGQGAGEQYIIESQNSAELRKPISAPLGFVFERGKAVLCKMLIGDEGINGG